jgi:preprotein translocase subunit YajC
MAPLIEAFLAQTADGAPAQNPIFGFLPFVLIAVVFYFVFFRPQAKQAKEHQRFVTELKRGDEVLTQGGMIGTIHQVDDRTVTLDVGGGTKIRVVKAQVAGPWKQVEAKAASAEARK